MHTPAAVVLALILTLTACASDAPTTATVSVGHLEFVVEVADTVQAQHTGLSGRDSLPEGTGMLFPFADHAVQKVWMAGMQIPIDIAWIVDGQVLTIDTLDPCTHTELSQCPRWTSPAPVDALLEVPAGALDQIEAGTPVTIRMANR